MKIIGLKEKMKIIGLMKGEVGGQIKNRIVGLQSKT